MKWHTRYELLLWHTYKLLLPLEFGAKMECGGNEPNRERGVDLRSLLGMNGINMGVKGDREGGRDRE